MGVCGGLVTRYSGTVQHYWEHSSTCSKFFVIFVDNYRILTNNNTELLRTHHFKTPRSGNCELPLTESEPLESGSPRARFFPRHRPKLMPLNALATGFSQSWPH